MDLIVSSPPEDQDDPVVVVVPIKWMRPILKKYPRAFKILINNLIASNLFDEHNLKKSDYTAANAAEHASIDDILGWARATKDLILLDPFRETGSWDFVKNNTPTEVMMGFDMEVGGDGDGEHLIELIGELPENVDNLVFPLHNGGEGITGLLHFADSNHLDNEKTIRMVSGSDEYPEIDIGRILTPAVEDFLQEFTMLPKGLYKIMNLSDMGLNNFKATINYHKLKI